MVEFQVLSRFVLTENDFISNKHLSMDSNNDLMNFIKAPFHSPLDIEGSPRHARTTKYALPAILA